MSTNNRMPIITFGDDTDFETLNGLLFPTHGLGWIVSLTMNDGSEVEVEWRGLSIDDRDMVVVRDQWPEEMAQHLLGIDRTIPVPDIAIITIQ